MALEPAYEPEGKENPIDLRHYLHVILKRRWVILAVLAVILVSAALKTYTDTPIFRANTRLVIERNISSALTPNEMMMYDFWDQKFYNTHYAIIKSRAVAEAVIDRLGLENSEEFFPKPKDDPVSRLKRSVGQTVAGWKRSFVSLFKDEPPAARANVPAPGSGAPAAAGKPDAGLVAVVRGRISVTPVPESRLVDIGFSARDPVQAAALANAVAEAYIDLTLDTRLKSLKNAVQWLGDRIEVERRKVDEAEIALVRYKEEHGIITGFSSDVEQVTAQKIAELNSQVLAAESLRVEAETLYKQALALKGSPRLIDSIPAVLNNSLISEIKSMEVDVYKRMSELADKYGPNHPRMVALNAELKELEKRKVPEVERVINSLKNSYEVAQAREQSLKSAFEEQKKEALLLNGKAVQYSLLSREAQSAREIYDLLVQRFNAITMAEDIKAEYIRVIDGAEVPGGPVSPNRPRVLMMALLAGLVLGVGAAFLLEYLDNTIKAPEDLKTFLDVAFLGPIPSLQQNGQPQEAGGPGAELVCANLPKSTTSEAYRGIRTNLLLSVAGAVPQVILIASSAPREGKSLTTANLAVTMAQAGSKTIIVDCDLRKPRIHKIFGAKTDRGLTTLLVNADGLQDTIHPTRIAGLDVIPCGPIPPNPSELLGSSRMAELLAALRETYDRILLDSPPTSAVTDAVILSNMVDGVVLVVRAGHTAKKVAAAGAHQIRAVGGRILGAVLNAVDADRDRYYYQNYYYYQYYGDEAKKQKKTRRQKKSRSAYGS